MGDLILRFWRLQNEVLAGLFLNLTVRLRRCFHFRGWFAERPHQVELFCELVDGQVVDVQKNIDTGDPSSVIMPCFA